MRLLLGAACAAVLAVAGTVTATNAYAEADRTITSNSTGTHNGYFYSYWKDSGNVTMTLGAGGNYSVQWNSINNSVVGKGWNPGSSHTVNYSGSFNCGGNCYLALYGWTTQPAHRVLHRRELRQLQPEYAAPPGWARSPPTAAPTTSTAPSGSTSPSINGTATFYQYWSVRQQQRTGGTITTANHFNAWANARPEPRQPTTTRSWPPRATRAAAAPTSPSAKAAAAARPGPPPAAGGGGKLHRRRVSAGQQWGDRFNLNVAVSGTNNWIVSLGLSGGQSLQNSWNASVSGTSGTVTARPNGNGNNFGITIMANGNWNWPTVTCRTG